MQKEWICRNLKFVIDLKHKTIKNKYKITDKLGQQTSSNKLSAKLVAYYRQATFQQ
jgi:hypothetical protein